MTSTHVYAGVTGCVEICFYELENGKETYCKKTR